MYLFIYDKGLCYIVNCTKILNFFSKSSILVPNMYSLTLYLFYLGIIVEKSETRIKPDGGTEEFLTFQV